MWRVRERALLMCLQDELATLRHCMGFGLALRQLQPAGQLAVFRRQASVRSSPHVQLRCWHLLVWASRCTCPSAALPNHRIGRMLSIRQPNESAS